MEAQDPLSQLRDIHLPDTVPFWPPAPGWWVLLVLALAALVFAYRKSIALMIRRHKLNAVLRELDAALAHFNEQALVPQRRNQAGLDYLARVNELLNRVVLVMYPDVRLGRLSGGAWLRYLDSFDNGNEFTAGPGAPLGDALYRPAFDADVDALHALAKRWIAARYREDDKARLKSRGLTA